MYKSTNRERGLGVRTSSGDWRHRPISPSNSTTHSPGPNVRSTSPLKRQSIPSGASKSVAVLQQEWRMQQQQQQQQELPSKRSNSRYPLPKPKRIPEEVKYAAEGSSNDVEVIYDEEEFGENIEEERMVVVQDMRSRSPSINRSSGGSIHSQTSIPYQGPQEFRVVKEGWMYRKNGLMQWKPVYAVAKHGNSVKPGGLYLYKDVKCTNHIQTYDMSEVLEISPRAQEYKPGIKWEIRMLVKRDDVILGTDDLISRKDWVDSLTSIMGKVSIATQNELTSRIQSSEQMNRDLQQVAEELNTENTQLREQIESLKEAMAKKEQQFQQRLQIKETEIKEALEKQEQLFQEDFQARELELSAELNHTRQALETKCEVFEREAKQWRTKYVDLESKMTTSNADAGSHRQAKIDLLEMEILKWRRKVDELEQKEVECKKMAAKSEGSDVVNETLSDVKFNIQLLRDQLKNGVSSETPILDDIKKSISNLSDALEEARSDWKQLENDIIKFLETEKQDAEGKQANQKHNLTLLADDINHLREELVGVSTQDEEHEKKMPSLTEKFDILIDMVENLQIGQSRLACSVSERPIDSEKNTGDYQQKLDTWMQEVRQAIESSSSPPSSDVNSLYDKLLTKIDDTMSELIKNQEETQDEQIKHIKTIANYLQLMTNDIQSSAIPDLPALSQQLEDVVERLAATENRLSQANSVSKPMPPQPTWTPSPSSSEEFKNMPHISEDDKLAQLNNFVKNTERFMEHVLLVLNRYEGNNPNGMEEIVRRAVKNASKLQIEQVISLQEQHAEERKEMDRKIQRYEENARGYFDKSMEKMHSDLHEFTGVMYEMLERLVLQALEHGENVANGEIPDQQQKSIKSVIDLHVKLSSLNQVLKAEIERLEQEKEDLDENMKRMKRDNNELEKELEKKQVELRSIQSEHERLNKEIQRSRQDSTAQLAKELEPLMSQIMKLKKMATITPEEKDDSFMDLDAEIISPPKSPLPNNRHSRYEENEETDRKLRFPNHRQGSFSSQFSDNNENRTRHEQQPLKSPLIGVRDRPRGKSPLAGFLGRNIIL
ncbi:hypothetical protein G6F47_011557 [Rhizopus delemar]|uniref:PH domain-containing protein n=1 Tax=Rhizopus delemar (strain RA 99-880 / ATCC MYA-4621 / FGSC 9543 / NRRL 43880) TaxID=246409 RepID=I1CFG6_RHIO9|nr:hypothetical protein RO3G_11907 [Rhizopus delemar RA 99-880]KAG1501112.1 hypothetical protein G6F54_003268 [Rhizopus delemar]KAG1505959.1 hypothetical protein G6F53_010036 [Rhizopus delemar]KAG1545124.1 hypothetical protein G6F49_010889 [Rhizopus delemar]KAG1585152.1 hypothetical protein G6F47_011557 [Rhizopus delemar]|eukprot:EIE87196.1 hypothetical protein RO3G_11907 [Rhizopus delemar RA 99-880]